MHRKPQYRVEICCEDCLVIRDIGPWDRFPSVTNAAEIVVAEVHAQHGLPARRQLLYFDSCGQLDEIWHDGQGKFLGFRPGPRVQPSTGSRRG